MANTQKQALLGRELKEGGFKEAYHSLPHNMLQKAREEICNTCYWNANSFSSRLHGKRPFRIWEIEQIEKFFEQYNLNAWTGEQLTIK